jgi:hypothetical protein
MCLCPQAPQANTRLIPEASRIGIRKVEMIFVFKIHVFIKIRDKWNALTLILFKNILTNYNNQ